MSTKVKKMVRGLQPDIRIALEGENGHDSIMTYSNLDKISGTVSITCHHATPFEALEITSVSYTHLTLPTIYSV